MKEKIVSWIKEYVKDNFKLVVGVSGGIDSAVVSTLCALTGIETHVISIPIKQNNSQLIRAKNHIGWLKMKYKNVISHEYDLSDVFDLISYKFNNPYNSELALANTKSRLRMVTLYQIATSVNGVVVGTGNKVEDFGVGFYTKYGDGGVDISPIGDLTKTEVRQLAIELGINEEIILAKPTDGLWGDDRDDETQLGATYEELEWCMDFMEKNPYYPIIKNDNLTDREIEILNIYNYHNTKNKHKMLPIPIFKK
jgi:NAD+ synthase